ncbi:MAG: WYL domain-containing protein [Oscillospiraceae bacterium]|nr:WYL domain-containing protein [Oscillospiraceae bacterium]
MAKSEGQKLKLLYLKDYLCQNTDESHPATMKELLEHLENLGIKAERKSLYSDLAALNLYGLEIEYCRGKQEGYYVKKRQFELSELKFLVDAVLSSRFLSPKHSAELIRKLAAQSSIHEAALLRREIVLAGRIKSESEENLSAVDVIHEAIALNRKIHFRYFDWGVDLKKHFRKGVYEASPYALIWDDENYYMVAHSARHGLTHYRVDKMEEIFLAEEPRTVTEETVDFDPGLYSKEMFGMFRGERINVKLRFENSLAGVVVDRFGKDILMTPQAEGYFTFQAKIALSPNFFAWLCRFAGRATIIYPQTAVEAFRNYCHSILSVIPE